MTVSFCTWGPRSNQRTTCRVRDGIRVPAIPEADGRHPPEFPHAYFALGYGGNGMIFSVIAAKIITDLHLRRPNPDADIFRFDR